MNIDDYNDEFNSGFSDGDEFNNFDSITRGLSELTKVVQDFRDSFNDSFTGQSPGHVFIDGVKGGLSLGSGFGDGDDPGDHGNMFAREATLVTLAQSDRNFFTKLIRGIETDAIVDAVEDVTSSVDSVNDNVNDIKKNVDRIKDHSGSATSGLGTIVKAIGGALMSLLGTAFDAFSERAISDVNKMIESRNDIMYQYGISDPAEADRLYKMQFDYQLMPFQHRTAPEQREFERNQRATALEMGFNTEQSVTNVTNELIKWKDIFEDIDFSSSQLFKTTMRFVDKTGDAFDEIMSKVEQLSTDYVVTPDLLMEVSNGYAKYLRTITKNNVAYVKSMNNLIDTVAKLEDAGVDAESYLDEVQEFMYSDLGNAADSDMWTRLSVLGIDPYNALTNMSTDELYEAYTGALKNYFSGYDLSNGEDRLQVNTLAQEVFGFSTGEMQNLYDLLQATPSSGSTEGDAASSGDPQLTTLNDYAEKIKLEQEAYHEKALEQWSYVSDAQRAQNAMTKKILDSNLGKAIADFQTSTLGGFIDLQTVTNTISSFLVGGGLFKMLSTIFGGGSTGGGFLGSLLGRGAGGAAAEGAAGAGGVAASTLAGGALLAGGLIWGGIDAYHGVQNSVDWLGEERGNSLSGKVSSGIAGFFSGTGPGVFDENATTGEKAAGVAANAGKFGLVGAGIGTLIAPGVGTAIGAGVGAAAGALLSLPGGEEVANAIKDWWDYTKEWGINAWEEISPYAEKAWGDIKEASVTMWDDTKSLGSTVWNFITGEGDTSWEDVKVSAGSFWEDAKVQASTLWGDFLDTADVTIDNVFDYFGLDWESTKQSISEGWDNVKEWGIDAFNTAVGTGDMLLQNMFGMTDDEWVEFKDNAKEAFDKIGEWASELWTNFKDWAKGAWDSITKGFSDAVDAVEEWYEDSGAKDWVDDKVDSVKKGLNDAGDWISNKASDAWNGITGFFGKAKERGESITGIKSHASGLDYVPYDNYFANLHRGEAVLTANENRSLLSTMTDAWSSVKSMVGNVWDNAKGKAHQIYDTVSGWISPDDLEESDKLYKTGNELTDKNNLLTGDLIDQFSDTNKNNMYSTTNSLYKSTDNNTISVDKLTKMYDPNNKDGITYTENENTESVNESSSWISKSIDAMGNLKNKIGELATNLMNGSLFSGGGSSSSSISTDSLTSAASDLISKFEGSPTSINANDNGALSIGKMQWHGDNAKSLLKSIYDADPSTFQSIASQYGATGLVNSVTGNGSWSSKTLTAGTPEYNAIKAILGTSAGQSTQDTMQAQYINSYFDKGKSYGLSDAGALLYFADFANQYGTNSSLLKTITQEALQNGGTVDAMYNATLNHTSNYLSRRKSAYEQIKGMDLSSIGGGSISGISAVRNKMINFAKSKLGTPYVWGAAGPNYYDCSGFVSAILNDAGFNVGRITTSGMRGNVTNVSSVNQLQPGDIMMGNSGKHTGIYVGDGKVIHSSGGSANTISNPGKGVTTSDWSTYWYGKWNGLGAYAEGGIVTSPTLSLIGEGGYNEYVISTDPQYADRSTALLQQAASDVGVAKLSTNAGTTEGVTEVVIDTDEIVDAIDTLTKLVEKGFKMFENMNAQSTPTPSEPSTNLITDYA